MIDENITVVDALKKIKEARELVARLSVIGIATEGLESPKKIRTSSLVIGEAYYFRAVTMYYIGRLKAITDLDVVLEEAVWVCDAGVYGETLTGNSDIGAYSVYEDDVGVLIAALVDYTKWPHPLPK